MVGKNKKILLAGSNDYYLLSEIEKNLVYLDFEVTKVLISSVKKYGNLIDRTINLYKKTFFKTRQHKIKKRFDLQAPDIEKQLQNAHFDYALFIRADFIPLSFITFIKKRLTPGNCIIYHWDGLKCHPEIRLYKKLADRFYVFDPEDVTKDTHPATNFYYDYIEYNPLQVNKQKVFYIGSYHKTRNLHLNAMVEKLSLQKNIEVDISLGSHQKNPEKNADIHPAIKFIKPISFETYLQRTLQAGFLVDFFSFSHHGLSFRVFEAIGYNKKLITNNPNLRFYEFYNENNFFIWKNNDFTGLEEFLEKPFIEFSPEIKEKYAFTNWIKYMLNIEPHIKIDLPHKWE